jgi:hypothetical protein
MVTMIHGPEPDVAVAGGSGRYDDWYGGAAAGYWAVGG